MIVKKDSQEFVLKLKIHFKCIKFCCKNVFYSLYMKNVQFYRFFEPKFGSCEIETVIFF